MRPPFDQRGVAVTAVPAPERHRAGEVFRMALGLGLTSFGGPIAHLGYFERASVRERRWLSAEDYAGLVALCQTLPGPASSQLGLLIGGQRAGWTGALAAWAGFTLPSALLLFGFARLAARMRGATFTAVSHALQLVAVAVAAQAVWSMARKLCPDRRRAGLALAAAASMLVAGSAGVQILALLAGALGGALLCRDLPDLPALPAMPVSLRAGGIALGLFLVLLVGLPLAAGIAPHSLVALAAIFYRAGALVFGGGHVVLPLLRDALVPTGWLSDDMFLAGYGAAQAVPGPLFTVSAYLGAVAAPAGASALWSAVAVLFMFLPGVLMAPALYGPIWTRAVTGGRDVAIALTGFLLLERWHVPPLAIVGFCVAAAVM